MFADNADASACAICQYALEVDGECHTLHCGHAFHTACIVPWFRRESPGCPLCRDTGEDLEEPTPEDMEMDDVETASTASASSTATSAQMRKMLLTELRRLTRSSDSAPQEAKRLLGKLTGCMCALKEAKQLLRLHAEHGHGHFKLLSKTQRHLKHRADQAAGAVRRAEDAALSSMENFVGSTE
jgi:hypothetical protein